MRVLHVGKFFPPHPGGIERTSADLCFGLATDGVDVAMIAHAEPGTHQSFSERVCDIELIRVACFGSWLFAPVSPTFRSQLKRALLRFRPDIIHVHMPNVSAFWLLTIAAARNIPWVVHWHADIPTDSRRFGLRAGYRVYRHFENALLQRATAIIATSQNYLDSSAPLQAYRSKVAVIPLGIDDVSLLKVSRESSERFEILAVGRMSYFKGFDVLIRALARVDNARLTLIGDGECAGSLRRLTSELSLESRIDFVGRVDLDERGAKILEAAYANADVFCLPSTERAESFGIVLLEAMRAERAIVASAISGSGVNFVVRDGETGLLVQPVNVTHLAEALIKLRDDVELRRRMGTAGRARFLENFTLSASVDRTKSLYASILSRTEHRAAATPTT